MKNQNQKRKSFSQEMERLKKEDNLKEEKQPFTNILTKSVTSKKQKPFSH